MRACGIRSLAIGSVSLAQGAPSGAHVTTGVTNGRSAWKRAGRSYISTAVPHNEDGSSKREG
eukprot:2748007-Karenia_brevis.AAC.1